MSANNYQQRNDDELEICLPSENDCEPLLSQPSQLHSDTQQRIQDYTMRDSEPKVLPQYVATLCATMGAIASGAVLGFSSPAGNLLIHNSTSLGITLTPEENSWFSSSSNLGALIGSPIAGFGINYFGRKGTMIYTIIPFIIGWAFIVGAKNFTMLLFGRIITGICCGLVSVSVPTYIGEFASCSIRGILGSCFQLMIVFGIFITYGLGALFDNWRWIAAICAIFPCIFCVLMIFNKESPSYLLLHNKDQEARAALDFFRGKNYVGTSKELEVIKASVELRQENAARLSDLVSKPHILKPFLMSLGLMFFQQFTGVNAVLFNLNIIFEESGSNLSPTLSSLIVGGVQVIATFIGASLMDKAGRKLLLILSAIGMIISQAALGLYFYFNTNNHEIADSITWLPLLSLVTFIFVFSIGYGPIPWLMMGELFSPEIKELAGSIASMFNWFFAFSTTLMFTPLQKVIMNYGVYWMFSGFCVLNLIFVITFVLETKGKTLQEISLYFGTPTASEMRQRRLSSIQPHAS